jgi:uncharacterized protein (TIGR02145 family)
MTGCGKKVTHTTDSPSTDESAAPATLSAPPTRTFTDGRDGRTYKMVKIGNQTWMAENLNYQTDSGSWCYMDSISYCDKYGRLYDWETAQTVCPDGWRLPEAYGLYGWERLAATAGGWKNAGKKLKSKSGWRDNKGKSGNGTDDYGFSALPGGRRFPGGSFSAIGFISDWWSATEGSLKTAHLAGVWYGDDVLREGYTDQKDHGLSVRCVAKGGMFTVGCTPEEGGACNDTVKTAANIDTSLSGAWLPKEGLAVAWPFPYYNAELLRDGTCYIDDDEGNCSWRTENKRLYITRGGKPVVFGYTVFGDSMTLADSIGRRQKYNSARFITGKADIEMVFVKGGTFTMGCTPEQEGACEGDEFPAHSVTLGDYYIGKYEVTQMQWRNIMGTEPSYFKGDSLPVGGVNWEQVQEFIRVLNVVTGKKYRLPTEAEWEYAARGGSKSMGYKYSGGDSISGVAWYVANSGKNVLNEEILKKAAEEGILWEEKHINNTDKGVYHGALLNSNKNRIRPVGTKRPNELGIHDMSGNVWEWCGSEYNDDYRSNVHTFPMNRAMIGRCVYRGGAWNAGARSARVSNRLSSLSGTGDPYVGFRLASVSP